LDQDVPNPPDELERARRDPLSSRALATARDDLIKPCSSQEPRPAQPAHSVQTPVALAFSGGGFRATLTALGVLRFLADAGMLERVRWASSVSGGSIANGLFADNYSAVASKGFSRQALDELVTNPFVARVSRQSLTLTLGRNAWRLIGSQTRTHLLARTLEEWFFASRLEDLPTECRFVFNAANLATGVRFGFERDVFGDYVMGRRFTAGSGLKLADAVAASAAVPGLFAPMKLDRFTFPCSDGRTASLVDGGAYDNSGLEVVDGLPNAFLVAVNAGGLFRTGMTGRIPLIRDLSRANALLYRQSTGLRRREMVDRFQEYERARRAGQPPPSWGRQGVLFGLATTVKNANPEWIQGRPHDEALRLELALLKTSFARFSRERCHQLLYRGWWLTGCNIATYHRELLPESLPHWEPPE
jgi:NTE family protein